MFPSLVLSGAPRHAGLLVALAAAGLAACRSSSGTPPPPPPPEVGVVTVVPETITESYEFVGEVQPVKRVEVRARVDGIIEERPFVEGALVRRGDVLYRLDRVRYEAAYRSAKARLENARRTLARLEPLLERNAIAQQDVDNARTELEAAEAAFDEAKKDLDDTVVRAEITGRVGRTALEVGARVTGPGDLLTVIDQLDPVYVTFRPSTQELLRWRRDPAARALVRAGSRLRVRVTLPDGTEVPRTGRLDYVSASVDGATGTQEFRAEFENEDRMLVPGEFVRVRLEGFTRESALVVPQRAVQQSLSRQFVLVVGPGDTVTARDIQVGEWIGDRWVIERGLAPGDRVIVDGVQKAMPGRTVRPVEGGAAGPRGSGAVDSAAAAMERQ